MGDEDIPTVARGVFYHPDAVPIHLCRRTAPNDALSVHTTVAAKNLFHAHAGGGVGGGAGGQHEDKAQPARPCLPGETFSTKTTVPFTMPYSDETQAKLFSLICQKLSRNWRASGRQGINLGSSTFVMADDE
jgi:hypothetical protein